MASTELNITRRQRGPNSSQSIPRIVNDECHNRIISLVRTAYLSSVKFPSLLSITENICTQEWDYIRSSFTKNAKENNLKSIKEHFYKKRIIRKDKYYIGPYHSENWPKLWRDSHPDWPYEKSKKNKVIEKHFNPAPIQKNIYNTISDIEKLISILQSDIKILGEGINVNMRDEIEKVAKVAKSLIQFKNQYSQNKVVQGCLRRLFKVV